VEQIDEMIVIILFVLVMAFLFITLDTSGSRLHKKLIDFETANELVCKGNLVTNFEINHVDNTYRVVDLENKRVFSVYSCKKLK